MGAIPREIDDRSEMRCGLQKGYSWRYQRHLEEEKSAGPLWRGGGHRGKKRDTNVLGGRNGAGIKQCG